MHFRPLLKGALVSLFFLNTACSVNTANVKSLNTNQAYLNQIPFVSGGDAEVDGQFMVNNDLIQKEMDPNVTWTYFDNLYNNSLPNSIKQELSYSILCKKDLIGLVKTGPYNATLVAALKKHVDNLVQTEYLGYTSLYFALDALKSTGEEDAYIKDKAAAIAKYAFNDPFHPDMIAGGVSGVGSQELYDKFVDNYSYVSKIETLK